MARKVFSYYGWSEFQNKMLIVFAGISLLQGAFFFLGAHLVILKLEGMVENGRMPASQTEFAEILSHQQTFLFLMVLASTLITTVAFVYLGLRYSHDAVGAIYRIKKDVIQMTESGQIQKLSTRKNDYFKDVQEALNDFIEKFRR